jgi:hypothetical protein
VTAGDERCEAGGASLRRTCLHEYAHLAVARHFGAAGFVTIRALSGDARYAGRFQMFGELSDSEWRIVALAGALAECLDAEPGIDIEGLCARLAADPDLLCGVDAELARGFEVDDVRRCVEILGACWPSIEAEALAHASC